MAVITAVNGVWISFCLVCRPLRKVGPHQAACCHVSPPSSKSTYVCVHCYKCVCVSTAPGVCVCVCVRAHCSRCVCVCVCVCVHCSRCVCTWMGQIQRTHFTAGYTLYNYVCDKKKYIYLFFFYRYPIMVKCYISG